MLELLQNEQTLAEIASKHNILPQNLVNWKKAFLANAEIAMEPSKAVKEYKEELIKSQEQNESLTALVSKVTVERGWLAKKTKKIGFIQTKQLVNLKLFSFFTMLPEYVKLRLIKPKHGAYPKKVK